MPAAFAELEKTATPEVMKRQGITLDKREALTLATGKAVLVMGRQDADKVRFRKWLLIASAPNMTALVTVQVPEAASADYPDAAIRTALESLVIRASVPIPEQLTLLPFKDNVPPLMLRVANPASPSAC